MIIILLAAAAVSLFASHEWHDAVIILLVVVLNAIMGVIQEAKAEEAIECLKGNGFSGCQGSPKWQCGNHQVP